MKDWKFSRACQSAANDAATKTLKLARYHRPSGRKEPAAQHYQMSFQGRNNNIHMYHNHPALAKVSAVHYTASTVIHYP
jgi:hypothetical protein